MLSISKKLRTSARILRYFFGTNLPATVAPSLHPLHPFHPWSEHPAWAVSISWPSPINCLHPDFNATAPSTSSSTLSSKLPKCHQMSLNLIKCQISIKCDHCDLQIYRNLCHQHWSQSLEPCNAETIGKYQWRWEVGAPFFPLGVSTG